MHHSNQKLVNLGCGRIYHKEWDNFDISPIDKNVTRLDLNQELPFSSNSVHAIYSSHVLEHLTRYHALFFLTECRRVLCAGSTLRLVVPDLEAIVRLYLENLEKAISGDHAAAQRYQWMMLELFDQLIRTQSGGEMLNFWHEKPLPEENFIRSRMGEEYDHFLQVYRSLSPEEQVTQQRIIQHKLMKSNGQTANSFLESGERHHWMYDRYSLSLILQEKGFEEITICTATESRVSNFSNYHLDTDINGNVRKPDSLFIEAIKGQS